MGVTSVVFTIIKFEGSLRLTFITSHFVHHFNLMPYFCLIINYLKIAITTIFANSHQLKAHL